METTVAILPLLAFDEDRLLAPYQAISYVHDEKRGYIVWRPGTGLNVELLHIKVAETGRGHATWLLHSMLHALGKPGERPYATVYGFTRVSNETAQEFYRAMGFGLTEVEGVYDEGRAVLFSQRYDRLCQIHQVAVNKEYK